MRKQIDEQFDNRISSCIEWHGLNEHHICFEKSTFSFTRNHVLYCVDITVLHKEKCITIKTEIPVLLKDLYLCLGDIRRFEYLFDGAFYNMNKCFADGEEITKFIDNLELGYFRSAGYKHKIPLDLPNKEYKKYFLRWHKLQNELGIINQMELFGNCIGGITADMRLSMLIECYEALGKRLEKKYGLSVSPEPNTIKTVKCSKCGANNPIAIKGKRTLACYIRAIIDKYGKTVFKTEFRRRKTLIRCIIKTRNKVFHVNSRQKKTLNGKQCGFYSIKLDWMYRYIIWLLLGYDQEELDGLIVREIEKFEKDFPQLIY